MINIEFTEETISALRWLRFEHPHPRVQLKMEALLLKSAGLSHEKICEILDICGNTLRGYFLQYGESGIEGLKELHFNRPTSSLVEHRTTLEEHFKKNPVPSIKQAAHEIEKLTGIRRSQTQIRKFFNVMGMKRRKIGSVPAKADVEKQEQFHWCPVRGTA